MQIRAEDVRAIVSAVEWIVDGTLSEIRIRREGRTIFAARMNGDALQIDPEVMPAELAQKLLHDTELLGSPSEQTESTERTSARGPSPAGGNREPVQSKARV